MLQLGQSALKMGPMGGFLGFDMGVIIALAQALGYEAGLVAELIGEAQPVIVEKLNQK